MSMSEFSGEKIAKDPLKQIEKILTFDENTNFDAEEVLFVPLFLSVIEDDYVKKVLDLLTKPKVKNLWIVIGKKQMGNSNHKSLSVTLDRIRNVVEQVRKAIIQCSNLTILRIVCTVDVAVASYKSDSFTQWPLYQCKLEGLNIHGIKFDSFLPEEVLSVILSKATYIELCYEKKGDRLREEKAWQILKMAKKTLVNARIQCQSDLPFEGADSYPYKTKPCKNIYFPKLYELNLDIYDEESEWENVDKKASKEISPDGRSCGDWRYSLSLPAIDHVAILNSTPAYVLESLSDNRIKSLHLDVFTAESLLYLEAMKLNFKLNRLSLGFSPAKTYFFKFPKKNSTNKYASSFLQTAIKSLSHVWLRILDIYGLANDNGDDLVKFLSIRESFPFSTNIRFSRMIYCHRISNCNFRWIKQHLEQFHSLGGGKIDGQVHTYIHDITGRFSCENFENV